ncbi:hypothetical protein CCMSSC00406_0001766 [Pleurotus cornucopiae]|uniref:Uncharacterized protein n=1 Tax=Pleurotus cornucopiae TaxID=5321 RepID=A0ACB7IN92_PLECO|nr:hypothetical protein CCMSSC00406_0001766 [Pleurotus cornucopiae]
MAPKPSLATLFHPKKKTAKPAAQTTPVKSAPTGPRKSSATPRPKLAAEAEDDSLKLPDGPYQEFRLMSSALNGWKYDVMKFDSRKAIDISTWQPPIKLNRKEMRREDDTATSAGPEAVGPMMGPDGKPVIGVDGRVVMVDAEGRPIHPESGSSSKGGDAKGKGPANAKKRFQKKTKQVFLVPDEVRQLRKEERYPWVIEDSSGKEVWVGKLEEVAQAETRAFFMPAANDVFKFVPAHRWYKFQKKPQYVIWSAEEAEAIASIHSNRIIAWANSKLTACRQDVSAATTAAFKAGAEGRSVAGGPNSLVHTAGQSLGPGGRRLKTVDSGMDHLFGDDDDDEGGMKRRREKELGEEGDLDEVIFEEEFADDEEPMEVDDNDEEAKEQAERMKREQKAANKTQEGYIDADEEEEGGTLTKDGKRYKKMLRNRDGNDAYDSEEEENPYASSVEEEEDEDMVPVPLADPALQPKAEEPSTGSQPQKTAAPRPPNGSVNVKSESRATSPVPNIGHGGHSIVAKRATSPKASKSKTGSASRGGSPLASRPGSPPAAVGSRAGSPVATNKRKAMDDPSSPTSPTSPNPNGASGPPKLKKRKPLPPGGAPVGELDDKMVIEWLRNTPNATTRDCIQHFTPYLTEEAKKAKFTALVKEVAQLKGGVLVLRNAYRTGSAAPSPAATA